MDHKTLIEPLPPQQSAAQLQDAAQGALARARAMREIQSGSFANASGAPAAAGQSAEPGPPTLKKSASFGDADGRMSHSNPGGDANGSSTGQGAKIVRTNSFNSLG